VASASSSVFAGLTQVIKMGLAGRRFLDKANYMSHCVVEAGNRKELNGQIALLREVVQPYGFDLPNTVPTVIRAAPFPPLDVLSPTGQRLLPIHTILPLSKVLEFHQRLTEYLEEHRTLMVQHGITQQPILGTMGTNGFLYEPVFYWDDSIGEYHKRHTNPEIVAKVSDRADNPEARVVIEKFRVDIIKLMHEHGGVHMQIGKMYPYLQDRKPESLALLKAIKTQLDPKDLINPGALGLNKH